MADESIGTVGLDIEISQKAAQREATKTGGTIQRALGSSIQATERSLRNMFSSLAHGGRSGSGSVGMISTEAERLTRELDNVNTMIGIQEEKLARLRQQYQYLSETGLGDSDRGLKLQEQITKAEANILKLVKTSDKTAKALWKVDDALQKTAKTGEAASGKLVAAGDNVNSTFKRMGSTATGMATTIKRAFSRVLRQIFIIAVLYKAIRGFLDYIGNALKTNQEFSRSLEIIKTNLAVAFQPIMRAVMPALVTLARGLATATTYVATFISMLFGQSYKENFEAAQQLHQATDAMDAYGKAAKNAKRSLLGFDEIHTLGTPDAGGDQVVAPGLVMPDTTEAERRIGGLFAVLGYIGDKFSWVGGIVSTVWNTVIAPMIESFRNRASKAILVVRMLWDEHGEGIVDGAKEFIKNLELTWNLLWTQILEPIIRPFWGEFLDMGDDGFIAFLAIVGDFIFRMAKSALDFYNDFIFPIVQWMTVEFGPKIVENFEKAMLGAALLKLFMDNVAKGLKRTFGGIIDFISGVFTGDWKRAWQGIKDIFGGIFDAFGPLIKKPLNSVADAANKLIRGINKFQIDVPSWVATLTGIKGGKFGFNIPLIPKLAQGGIIQQPTLAMVGERGREAVVPLENNTEWLDLVASKVVDMLRAAGFGDGDEGPLHIVVNIGSKKVLDEMVSAAKRKNAKAGQTVIQLGVT